MIEWKKCRKKPIIVEFREVTSPFEIVNTHEGLLRAEPEKDFIIKGIQGEYYPIKKDIFHQTYDVI